MIFRISIIILLAVLLGSGCSGTKFDPFTLFPTSTVTPLPPTETARVTPTPSITPTFTETIAPTPTWVSHAPGYVKVPIFMYHQIEVLPTGNEFYVPPAKFASEMKLLHDWGYTTITTSMLVQTITKGSSLPPRPIIITFDDSSKSQYVNAFPVMKKYGFIGVLYTVVGYINRTGGLSTNSQHLTIDELKEMAAAGWEIGSHTETHQNVTVMTDDQLHFEIVQSRKDLEQLLDVPVLTFAYPFGDTNRVVTDYVHFAGYIAAMDSNGCTGDQSTSNLFKLQRCEIKGSDDAESIIRFLPWLGDPAYIPTDTPIALATPFNIPVSTGTMVPASTSWMTKTP
jgi:peptidoglycan/xylan/chitin deacetylase (PgdA/CDA1 family)